jgi:hypothetical protein
VLSGANPGTRLRCIDERRDNSVTATRPIRAVYTRGPEANVVADAAETLEAPKAPDIPPTNEATDKPRTRPPAPNREELGALLDEFMEAAEVGEVEDGYGQYYTPEELRELHSALSHVKSELGTINVRAIHRWHVQGMLDELRRAGLAPGRLTAVVEALHAFYTYAIERGLVDDSPVIFLTFPRQPDSLGSATVQQPVRARTDPARPARFAAPPELQPEPDPVPAPAPPTPTPTHAMAALGGRVLLWTMRATVTIFVLIAIVLVVEFA